MTPAGQALRRHLTGLFSEGTLFAPTAGPIRTLVPDLHILRLPQQGTGQLYATAGLWDATARHGHGLEFVLAAPTTDDAIHVETLTMVAYYHASSGDYVLDHGHTVPIGRPWLPGSRCDHLLVSLPYPWGPELENCDVPGGHVRVLWLLPITAAEKRFRHSHGLEALEQRFEDAGIIPADPYRGTVVDDPS
ncbi:hypothetical protein Adi01nite_80310 [Amorphoplanes digitatis]|nr:hypothetical protein Adi01nite_80310 [Actinoplanes digitatis]